MQHAAREDDLGETTVVVCQLGQQAVVEKDVDEEAQIFKRCRFAFSVSARFFPRLRLPDHPEILGKEPITDSSVGFQ